MEERRLDDAELMTWKIVGSLARKGHSKDLFFGQENEGLRAELSRWLCNG